MAVLAKTIDMSRDEWLQVPGFDGLYEVNCFGDIKSTPRYGTKGGILKQYLDRYGYLKVVLYKNNTPHYFTVHRLVAKTFIPNPMNKKTINHIDNDRRNNHVDNLEWASMKENLDHSHNQNRQSNNKKSIVGINTKTGKLEKFESQREASRKLKINQRNIHNVIYGKNKARTCKGWFFKYA